MAKNRFKNIICLMLIVFMQMNLYASVVSDNDGAAFVTKAEFEALKNNFAMQIDNYTDSIGSKTDGAIASYLAGIKLSKQETYNGFVEVTGDADSKYIYGRKKTMNKLQNSFGMT